MSSSPEPHCSSPISPSKASNQLRQTLSFTDGPASSSHRWTSQHLRTSDLRLGSLSSISSSPIYIDA
ncbi:hypothetical protein D9611_010662 [Ephemerocybe angulata]|uniref:Uncharacterized protein n=1 Tax=Ephemerocybe angulata TaxID=980116 RepID=A0A8H5BDY2_9AGAR|nr:hypothetical protein D9611_010662 [Tulosesus angulatus]